MNPLRKTELVLAQMVCLLALCTLGGVVEGQEPFIRGDVDGNGVVDFVVDAAYLSVALFSAGPAPGCLDAADFNDDGSMDLTDIQWLLSTGFVAAASIPPPYPNCGLDPTPDALPCAVAGACSPPPPPPISGDLALSFSGAIDVGGGQSDVTVLFANNGGDLAGWSFGVCHDPSSADILGVDAGPDLTALDPDFENRAVYPGVGWTCATLLSFTGDTVLGPGVYQLYDASYATFGTADSTLGVCAGIGDPPVPISFAGSSGGGGAPVDTIAPTTFEGTVVPDIVVGGFIRGDPNGEGVVNLADSIFLINWVFQDGPEPPCLRAGDANDDGTLNIADSIWLINYFFLSGPPPPPPFPTCGEDPTADGLSCGSYGPCR